MAEASGDWLNSAKRAFLLVQPIGATLRGALEESMSLLRPWAKRTVRLAFGLLPPAIAGKAVRRYPHLVSCLSPGRSILIPDYLGDVTVRVDMLYPIEQEMMSGVYDPTTMRIIERHVPEGAVCFDVGANVGALTLALAKAVGQGGKVHAFEPGPPIFGRLAENLALNPTLHDRVVLVPYGLSDRETELYWSEDPNNRGNAGLLGGDGLPVPITTLDRYCARQHVRRLDFLKLDVEGMEYEVIKGGVHTIRTLRPIMYYETLSEFVGIRGFDIFRHIEQLLSGAGYSFYKVHDNGTTTRTRSPDLSRNTLAIPATGTSTSRGFPSRDLQSDSPTP